MMYQVVVWVVLVLGVVTTTGVGSREEEGERVSYHGYSGNIFIYMLSCVVNKLLVVL